MININYGAHVFSEQNIDNNLISVEKRLEKLDILDDFAMYYNNVCFTFENNNYTFFIDKNNIFGISGNPICYSASDLFLNAVNIVRYHMKSKYMKNGDFRYASPILNLLNDKFIEYAKLYEKPTIELMKLYYQELLSVGLCEVNSMLTVMEFLKNFVLFSFKGNWLEEWVYKENGKKYNLLYSSFFHSLDFLKLVDGFQHQDTVNEINNLSPAVFETQIGVYDNKPMILYTNIDIMALFTFDKFQLVQNNFKIRTCEVCNKYFVNTDNKKYHSKVCPDCRTLSQRKRKSDNEFYLAYDRAYKAMYNRLRYLAIDSNQYYTKYFKPCIDEIKEKQSYYEKKNDLNGFQQFIEKTKDKYKVNKS